MKNEIVEWSSVEWTPSRPDVATGVTGHRLVPPNAEVLSVVLTRVRPAGRFASHRDDYSHVFCFVEGSGKGRVGDDEYRIRPGLIVHVSSGTLHSYENTSPDDLVLFTVNYRLR